MDDYMMKNRRVAGSLTKVWMITGRQKKAKEARGWKGREAKATEASA
jgi:hypothetical protein